MMNIISAADIMLPRRQHPLEKWAVIACDQFTSEPEYWQQVRDLTTGACSTGALVFPEAELGVRGSDYIDQIHETMIRYQQEGIYDTFPAAFIYVERLQADGSLRKGIVCCLDLEAYEYTAGSKAPVRASEETVTSRIPARVAVREGAQTETSHVILYADDDRDALITCASAAKESGKLLYDFDLMMDGGHIAGWLLDEKTKEALEETLEIYCRGQEEKAAQLGKAPLLFAVGDGNHSLAAAKSCYEKAKASDPAASSSPLRYALVEVENIHDPAQVFHPIHRIVRGIDPAAFLDGLRALGHSAGTSETAQTFQVPVLTAEREEILDLTAQDPAGLIRSLQHYIDAYIGQHGGEVDYIHGSDTLRQMVGAADAGILMPLIPKKEFFRDILQQDCFARKSFSIGNARDKRYYLEVRCLSR